MAFSIVNYPSTAFDEILVDTGIANKQIKSIYLFRDDFRKCSNSDIDHFYLMILMVILCVSLIK